MKKQISLKIYLISLVLLSIVLTSGFYVVYSQSGSFTINEGIYSGAPSYTIWREGDYYYAKNAYGHIDYYGANASQITQNSINNLPNGGGVILFKRTTYNFDSPIAILKHAVYLLGEGYARIAGDQPTFIGANPTYFNITSSMDSFITFGNLGSVVYNEGGISEIQINGEMLSNVGINISNTHSVRITDTIIENFINYHIYARSNLAGGISNIQINKNLIRTTKIGYIGGVGLYLGSGVGESFIYENYFSGLSYYSILLGGSGNIDVHDNHIESMFHASGSLYTFHSGTGIYSQQVGTRIHDNRITNVPFDGIYITGTYSTVSNNILSQVNADNTTGVGIFFEGNNQVFTIIGNIIGSPSTPYPNYGMYFSITGNATVTANSFQHFKTSAIGINAGTILIRSNIGVSDN